VNVRIGIVDRIRSTVPGTLALESVLAKVSVKLAIWRSQQGLWRVLARQQLKQRAPQRFDLGRVRLDSHAVHQRGGARGKGTGGSLHVDDAQPAATVRF
jgi:hypothetical protein